MKSQLAEWLAQHVWPWQRKFLIRQLPRRCNDCILMLKDEDRDICRLCIEKKQEGIWHPPQGNPIRLPADTAEEFILLFSGGKDSVVLLDRLLSLCPNAQVTCLLVNTGFMSPIAIKNAMATAESLRVKLLIDNAHIDTFRNVLREAFLNLKGRGCYGIVDFAEGSLVHQIGKETAGGRRIISGLTHAQLEHIETGEAEDIIFPLDWWRISAKDMQIRAEELLGKDSVSPLVTNSILIPVMVAVDMLNLGFSSFEPEIAQLIRDGEADRDVWLNRFEMLRYLVLTGRFEKELESGLQLLNLKKGDVVWRRS